MVEWTIVDEIRLFRWVSEFKPAGVEKHFNVLAIVERMNNPQNYPITLLQKDVVRNDKNFTADDIWNKLSQYYELEKMDKVENNKWGTIYGDKDQSGIEKSHHKSDNLTEKEIIMKQGQKEFELPWDEYGDLIIENAQNKGISNNQKVREDVQIEKKGSENLKEEETSSSNHDEMISQPSPQTPTQISSSVSVSELSGENNDETSNEPARQDQDTNLEIENNEEDEEKLNEKVVEGSVDGNNDDSNLSTGEMSNQAREKEIMEVNSTPELEETPLIKSNKEIVNSEYLSKHSEEENTTDVAEDEAIANESEEHNAVEEHKDLDNEPSKVKDNDKNVEIENESDNGITDTNERKSIKEEKETVHHETDLKDKKKSKPVQGIDTSNIIGAASGNDNAEETSNPRRTGRFLRNNRRHTSKDTENKDVEEYLNDPDANLVIKDDSRKSFPEITAPTRRTTKEITEQENTSFKEANEEESEEHNIDIADKDELEKDEKEDGEEAEEKQEREQEEVNLEEQQTDEPDLHTNNDHESKDSLIADKRPLAKRTRHAFTVDNEIEKDKNSEDANSEQSPKRRKRKGESPVVTTRSSTRVSARLRNRK